MKFPQVWDLERFFKGGSASQLFKKTYKETKTKLISLETLLKNTQLSAAISLSQEINLILREMEAFVECLLAQNAYDTEARILNNDMRQLLTTFSNLVILFDETLKDLPDSAFEALIEQHQNIAFSLKEKRIRAQHKLSCREESFINELGIDGYHGWSQVWETFIGEMTFPFQESTLFFGQIENKMADPNPQCRRQAFESISSQFGKYQSLFAQTLNHLGGFRLETYKKRGWGNFLKEPLEENRMEEATLNTMWDTIEKNKAPLVSYLECKAGLLKKKKLDWFDLEAPISTASKKISFDEAGDFVLTHFEAFSPKMAAFSKKALEDHWVEAEDRKGKSPGGFCIALPLKKESRIFMTFSNTMTNLFTLAHELGHAFHNLIIFPLPEMAQHIKMNVAETASTMAEMIVTKAAIEKETDPRERLFLLDDHLSRSVAYLMNIHARFLFEKSFYEARQKGFVSHENLNALMETAQKTAYKNSLGTYHPLFWAAKMHFYFTDAPFYNFPYTFGYLFSLGMYTLSKSDTQFEEKYIALLKDTGQMNIESLAQKHLQIDIKGPELWQRGLDVIKEDVATFIQLSKELM